MAAVDMPAELKERYRTKNAAAAQKAAFDRAESKRDGVPVHLIDIHLEKGMHCVDCHFVQDVHGNTKLYGEVRAAIEIQCIDCHGTAGKRANLLTTRPGGGHVRRRIRASRAATSRRCARRSGKRRFERRGDKIIQNSMVEPDLAWEVVQTADTIDPRAKHYNEKSQLAKTVRFDERQDGLGRPARRRRERLRPRERQA